MNANKLEQAVALPTDVLLEVLEAAYSIRALPEFTIVDIAHRTNKTLGFDLFEDLYYPRLVIDFAIVARAVARNAMKYQK